MKITNVNELRDAYQQKNPQGHFFDKDTLKFFGGVDVLHAVAQGYTGNHDALRGKAYLLCT